MAAADPFTVEVIYALPDRARRSKRTGVSPPASVADVLALAAADPDFRGIDMIGSAVGIFGNGGARDADSAARATGVELYRALAADPKEARRERVQRARDPDDRGGRPR